MTNQKKQSSEATIREIRRRTRRKFSPEEKIRIVLEGLRGEQSITDLCRREGIASNLYYRWSKDFLEAGGSPLISSPRSSEATLSGLLDQEHIVLGQLYVTSTGSALAQTFLVGISGRLSGAELPIFHASSSSRSVPKISRTSTRLSNSS